VGALQYEHLVEFQSTNLNVSKFTHNHSILGRVGNSLKLGTFSLLSNPPIQLTPISVNIKLLML